MKHLLILLTTLHFFTVGSIKANNNYNNNLKEVTYTNNLMTQSFPKYYQLYLIIVRDANGNGGWTNENLSNLESELQNVYGSKEIYFNLCITEIHDSYWYYNGVSQGDAESFLNTFKLNYSDGIKGILVKGGGWSANDHTKRFGADNVSTALHELGHCLGLLHTWEHPSSGQPVCGELAPKKMQMAPGHGEQMLLLQVIWLKILLLTLLNYILIAPFQVKYNLLDVFCPTH